MLKKRMLLLVASLAAFGAVMVSGAVANPTGTDSTDLDSGAVGVTNPVGVVYFGGPHTGSIPANGNTYAVDGIYVSEADPDYSMNLTGLSISDQGTGTCGTHTYSIGSWTNPTAVTGAGQWVAALGLSIPITANSGCTVSGATVQATFTATGS